MQSHTQRSPLKSHPLDSWLAGMRLGQPIEAGALALVPLYRAWKHRTMAYHTLATGLARGEVAVSESPQATVPSLRVVNQSHLPILILDGEEVAGGLQNRIANTTLLVPARSTFELPVSCVEQGRWRDGHGFGTGEAAYPRLRGQKLDQVTTAYATRGAPVADQSAIWGEVADRHRSVGSHSSTGAMRDVYTMCEMDLRQAEARLRCPHDQPIGVIALVAGRARCADIFDQPDTLRDYWHRLVRSYALEAGGAKSATPSLDSALRLLKRPLAARRSVYISPGLGRDMRITGNGVAGSALLCERVVVHTVLVRRR